MMKLGTIEFDAIELASQGSAILGIRDSGKSYSATCIAERFLDVGVPFVAFDPIGIWRWLKTPANHPAGKGYEIVVAGGAAGDLPLTPDAAPQIVRAALKEGVSLVIDLYDMKLSKADWKRIVAACVRVLLYENKDHGLRHVFIEEASEFCPQVIGNDQAAVYAEVEKLARMGGNALLGYTLINQRGEQVNKAVLELCDNLFLHRQKGRNSLTALSRWLDIGDAKGGKEIVASLPTLPQGECWIWAAGSDRPKRVKMPGKRSFHPDRRAMRGANPASELRGPTVDVSNFVDRMTVDLAAIAQDAKDNDPKKLKVEIAELRRRTASGSDPTEARQEGERIGVDRGIAIGREQGMFEFIEFVTGAMPSWFHRALMEQLESMRIGKSDPIALLTPGKIAGRSLGIAVIDDVPRETLAAVADGLWTPGKMANGSAPRRVSGPCSLPKGEKAVLAGVSRYPRGCTRTQIGLLTGYKRSTRDAFIQRLTARGFVEINNDGRIYAVTAGIEALGDDYERPPIGAALRKFWLDRLTGGENVIFGLLIEAFPQGMTRTELSEATEYKRSTRDAFVQRLTARELITANGRGEVRASEFLFANEG